MTGLALEGIIAYPVTPFAPGGEDGVTGRSEGGVDTDALTALVDRLIDAGCHAIAPLGSTGESAYLDDQEWYTAAEAALAAVAGRVPAVVGVADLTTRGAVRRARFAERAGADAVMVLPQAYWKLDEREVAGHFTAVADAVTVPVMLYNNPATSGVDLSPS